VKKFAKYVIIFWVAFLSLIIIMGSTRYVLLDGPRITGTPKQVILFLSSFISNVKLLAQKWDPIVIKDTSDLKNGFNYYNNYKGSKDYLLLGCWDAGLRQSIVKLVRISDGKELYKWAPDIKILNRKYNLTTTYGVKNYLDVHTTRLMHPKLLNDGSLVFVAGGIYKIDKNSKLIWSNDMPCHHSVEVGPDSNFWICGYNSSLVNSEKYHMEDDAIKEISAKDGRVIFEKSVYDILMENGYSRGYFFINPIISDFIPSYLDRTHLNQVQPVWSDSRYWKKGDLFISLRHQNMVFLYRPSENKIIWLQNGPWLRQHNVSIVDSSRISIFGNNVLDVKFMNDRRRLIDGHNTLYLYDFSTNTLSTPYETLFQYLKIGTITEGRSRVFENGDVFVEETNFGRLIYGDPEGVKWIYVERISKDKISMVSWCRYITEEEFKKLSFIKH